MVVLTYIDESNNKIEIQLPNLENYDVANLHLHRLGNKVPYDSTFENAINRNANFYNSNLRSSWFLKVTFENCNFDKAKFIAVSARDVTFNNCSFKETQFISSEFKHCYWIDCEFENTLDHNNELTDCNIRNFKG